MLAGLGVQHELREGAVQAGHRATHEGKARTRQFDGGFKIQPQALANLHMVLDRKIEIPGRAPAAHFHIALLVLTDRNAGVRQVGHGQQQVLQLDLQGFQTLGRCVKLVLEGIDLRHGGLGLLILAFAFEHADLPGQAVALALQFFGAGLQGLALGLERAVGLHIQKLLRIPAGLQPRNHGIEVFAEKGDI